MTIRSHRRNISCNYNIAPYEKKSINFFGVNILMIVHYGQDKKGISCVMRMWYNLRESNRRFFEVGTRNCINDEMTSDIEHDRL